MAKVLDDWIADETPKQVQRLGKFNGELRDAVKLAKANPGKPVQVNDEPVRKAYYDSMGERFGVLGENADEFEVKWSRKRTDRDVVETPKGEKRYQYFGFVQIKAKGETKKPARTR